MSRSVIKSNSGLFRAFTLTFTFPMHKVLFPVDGLPECQVVRSEMAQNFLTPRSKVVQPPDGLDPGLHHLFVFLHHAQVVPKKHAAPVEHGHGGGAGDVDDEMDMGGGGEMEDDEEEEDEGDGNGDGRGGDKDASGLRKWDRDVVILQGNLENGTSVAVKVLGWKHSFYVMPSDAMMAVDPDMSNITRIVKFVTDRLGTLDVICKPKVYGYIPDPTDPSKRKQFQFLRVRAGSFATMRRLCRALTDIAPEHGIARDKPGGGGGAAAAEYIERMRHDPLVNNSYQLACRVAKSTRQPFLTVEEGDRLKPAFKFLDEREIPPCSWMVLPRGHWKLTNRFSTRTMNVVVSSPSSVWSLDKLLDDPRIGKDVVMSGALGGSIPSRDTIPPSLFAYCDIEARSHDQAEFPDPSQPNAPCYMVGMSFVWSFDVPPALNALPPPSSSCSPPPPLSAWNLDDKLRCVGDEFEGKLAAAMDETRRLRAERLRARDVRKAKYSKREDVLGILESETVGELNSDDESDGEDAALGKCAKVITAERVAQEKILRDMTKTRVWGSLGAVPLSATAAAAPPSAAASPPGPMPNFPFMRVLLVIGSCDPIPGALVITFDSEQELLVWIRRVLFEIMDVDGIRGYNWLGFDTRYIVKRAELLGVGGSALRWNHLLSKPPSYDREEVQLSLQRGNFRMIRMNDTNTVDIMVYMRQQLDLASYKLDAIAQHFGIEGKHPVTPDDIYRAYEGTAAERAVVGAYCLRDCDVLVDIARSAQLEVTLMQFARIMVTQSETMWTSGQQIRVVHQLIRQAHLCGLVVDGLWRKHVDRALVTLDSGKSFSGGFVMKPIRDHYRTPTATMDFKSLYPSIMISHKLCYSTALLHPYDSDEHIARIRAAGLEVIRVNTESGKFAYVQHPVNLIPDMEWKLWVSRQTIKKEMKKAAGDPLMYAVLDAKQLAVKVSMNSTFGVTGAEHAMLGMKRIAASITHIGRTTVQAARDFADSLRAEDALVQIMGKEDTCKQDTCKQDTCAVQVLGAGARLRTVYGDTDSIMVNVPDSLHPDFVDWAVRNVLGDVDISAPSTRKALVMLACRFLGNYISDKLNAGYRRPMEIEFEEVASEAIFLRPKMYTKCVVEDVSDDVVRKVAAGGVVGKLKVAGIAAKRRDRSALTKRVQKAVAASIVQKGDPSRALQLVRRWVTRLALCEVNVDDFVTTTELKNPMERVGFVVQPHVAVAWAMEKKCKGSEPIRGERVPWLLVRKADLTRLEPPDTKRVSGQVVILDETHSKEQFARVSVASLGSAIKATRVLRYDPNTCIIKFGDKVVIPAGAGGNGNAESTPIGSLGILPGHALTVVYATGKPVTFRLAADCDSDTEPISDFDDDGDEDGDEDDDDADTFDNASPAKRRHVAAGAGAGAGAGAAGTGTGAGTGAGAGAAAGAGTGMLAKMMFHAREMSKEERANLGKRRPATNGLSAFARHPSELSSIKEVDTGKYMEHIKKSLKILLASTRPDLWCKMERTLIRAKPIMDVTQGKARQMTLKGFLKPVRDDEE